MHSDFSTLRAALVPRYGDSEARAIAFLVFEEGFGVSRTDIYADKVRHFSGDERERLLNISNLLAAGHPVQYVLGFTDFCSHRFEVGPGVLIPRPETEELVGWCLEEARRMEARTGGCKPLSIMDAGTGSGCIAISLKLALPGSEVSACDLSEQALAIARKNALNLGAAVSFSRTDLLQPWREGGFDILVSNPPYICESERRTMEEHVLEHEPDAALFVPDTDPMRFYRALATHAMNGALHPGGSLVVEINRGYGRETADTFRRCGLTQVELRQDAFGADRMVLGRRPC